MKSLKTCKSPGSFLLDYSAASSPSSRSLCRRSAASSSVHVVVVATHTDDSFMPLLYGCAILNVNVRVIGWKEELRGSREGWRARKILDLCEELEEDEVVVVLDSFYGLALQHKEVILEKFREFRAFIGYAGSIARVLAKARQEDTSVQALFSSLYKEKPNEIISIDVDCSIFHQCHSSNSIRILSFAEAHAVAVHQCPQLSAKSSPASADLSHPDPHSNSCHCLPRSPHPAILCSSDSSSRSVPSGAEHASSGYRETPSRQQQCVARPAPFFRPSPLQKIAMDAATGETPCFLHFSDRGCAAAILTRLEFFRRSQHSPRQRQVEEQLQHQDCQPKLTAHNYYTLLSFPSSVRNCPFPRLYGWMRLVYATCGIWRALLYVSLMAMGIFGIHASLAGSGVYGRFLGSLATICGRLLHVAAPLVSTGMTCCVQAYNYVKSIATFWLSIFVSCCVVGLCGAACCGTSKGPEEQNSRGWRRDCDTERMNAIAKAPPSRPNEKRQLLRQEWKQAQIERDKCMQEKLQQTQDAPQQRGVAARSRFGDASSSLECGAETMLHFKAQRRKCSRSSRRNKGLHDHGAREQSKQREDSHQRLMLHKEQEQKQLQQKPQAVQGRNSPQYRRSRHSVSRTRATKAQPSRRVSSKRGTHGKGSITADGCISPTLPRLWPGVATRQTRAICKRLAAAGVAGA